jgi:D-alanyl-D-alanine carboxypeptidase/D-alanyl-D-alanine-endopeptidase (penicillin-binding protein 4)
VLIGNLYLRGGGDPNFGERQAAELADQLVLDTGLREITGRVIGDESAFDSLRGPPSEGYRTTNEVGPLSALTFNRGRTGARRPYWQKRPPLFAARAFERALKRRDVVIGGAARTGRAQPAALPLAEHRSATMAELARLTNRPSDNFNAETLIKALGDEFGAGGTTRAGAAVVRRTMTGFGLRPRVADGSGLSRSNRTTPRQVVRLLQHMAEDDEAGPAFQTSLAVAGRSGTLENRMRRSVARDRCQAKTGTLNYVSALAGYCQTTSGARVAFAYLMTGVNVYGAHRLQDRMTAALARYSP